MPPLYPTWALEGMAWRYKGSFCR